MGGGAGSAYPRPCPGVFGVTVNGSTAIRTTRYCSSFGEVIASLVVPPHPKHHACRDEGQGQSRRPHERPPKLRMIRSPSLWLFSGWNWQAKMLSRATLETNGRP